MIFFDDLTEKVNHAGFKAKYDAAKIASDNGIKVEKLPLSLKGLGGRLISCFKLISRLIFLPQNKQVAFNYPLANPYNNIVLLLAKIKKLKITLLVHDLDSLRGSSSKEHGLIFYSERIISHNKKMNSYLISLGLKEDKISTLEIFDYLVSSDCGYLEEDSSVNNPTIIIAGNLSKNKSGYIYSWKPSVNCILYGVNYTPINNDYYDYRGVFDASNPGGMIDGCHNQSYGLVWDGVSVDTCSGDFGEYLRYNNPHKISLYLTLGIPVIVWSESAMADFVVENQCGFCIDSLADIELLVESNIKYYTHASNAKKIAEKLRSGFYLARALTE